MAHRFPLRLPHLMTGTLIWALGTFALGAPLPAQQSIELRSLNDPALHREASRAPLNESLLVSGVELFDGPQNTLEVSRFEVFAPGAKVHIDTGNGVETVDPPSTIHLRGTVQGKEDSMVVLSVDPAEGIQGLVVADGRMFAIGPDDTEPRVPGVQRKVGIRQVSDSWVAASDRSWECATDLLSTGPQTATDLLVAPIDRPAEAVPLPKNRYSVESYAVDVAIETDYEFRAKFPSNSAATYYVSSLFAAISAIYSRDVDTQLRVSDLWLYQSNNDPWDTSSPTGALYQVRDYWYANRTGVDRTITHFLSGKSMGGGVAWVGALCSTYVGYGVTGNISGSYSPSNPTMVWDLTAVAHEIGHNFNSRHTHRYSPPIDICYDECVDYNQATQTCDQWSHGQTPYEVPPDGGTIMSYCHLHSGGQSNINPYLGRAGYYGTDSQRVNAVMLAQVQAQSCLPTPVSQTGIFEDGFESGNTSSWN